MEDDEKVTGAGWVTWFCYNFFMLSFALLVFAMATEWLLKLASKAWPEAGFWPVLAGMCAVLIAFIPIFAPALIKHCFAYILEIQKREFVRRDKAAAISELLVIAQKSPLSEGDREKGNKILLDLCLYLPPCLIHKMAEALSNTEKGKALGGPFGVFVEFRKFMDGTYKPDPNSEFVADNIPQIRVTNAALNPVVPPKQTPEKLPVSQLPKS